MTAGEPRRSTPTWLIAVTGALVLAVLAVWGTIAISGSDQGDPVTTGPSTDPVTDPTTDPSGDGSTTPDDDPDDGLLTLTEAAGEAGFTATTSIWSGKAPTGFTLVETDQPGLWLESTPGCTVVLASEETPSSRGDDALATRDRIQDIQDTLGQINDNLQVTAPTSVVALPVMEDGSGGRIELDRFTVTYVGPGDTATETSVLLRTFHDLGVTLMLTYTCPTADQTLAFDDVLEAPLWVEPS